MRDCILNIPVKSKDLEGMNKDWLAVPNPKTTQKKKKVQSGDWLKHHCIKFQSKTRTCSAISEIFTKKEK